MRGTLTTGPPQHPSSNGFHMGGYIINGAFRMRSIDRRLEKNWKVGLAERVRDRL